VHAAHHLGTLAQQGIAAVSMGFVGLSLHGVVLGVRLRMGHARDFLSYGRCIVASVYQVGDLA